MEDNVITNVSELRKAGKLDEALELGLKELVEFPDDVWKKRNLAWVYYDLLKQNVSLGNFDKIKDILQNIVEIGLSNDERILFDNIAWQLVKIINTLSKEEKIDYIKVNDIFEICKSLYFEKPSVQYSALLRGFHKAYKGNRLKYTEMIEWWELENLMSEDYQKTIFEGTDIPALADQIYVGYAKHILPIKNVYGEVIFDKEKAENFLPILEEIGEKYPSYQYIPYRQAQILLALGDKENMLSALLPFARKKKNDFWIWDIISNAFEEDKNKVFACLCKGLSCPADEKMTTKLREKIIPFFLERKLYKEAKTEVNKIISIKETNGHNIPNNILSYKNTEWYKNAIAENSNIHLYKKYVPIAEEVLFSEFSEEYILVENINIDKKILNVITEKGERIYFKYDRILRNQIPIIGDIYKVRFSEINVDKPSKVATIIKSNNEKLQEEYVKDFLGNIYIPMGKDFGFVESIFVSPQLCRKYSLSNGNFIKGKAIQTFDKKKNKISWNAFWLCENI